MKSKICIWVAIAATLSACNPRNLYIAHDSILGLNASVDQGRQSGQFIFGYDRDFVTVIPKSVDTSGKNNAQVQTEDGHDAMSLVVCTELEVDGIFLNQYSDFIATGNAAEHLVAEKGELTPVKDNCKKDAQQPAEDSQQ